MTFDDDDKEWLKMLMQPCRDDVEDLKKCIYGNGKEGLKTKTERHETIVKALVWVTALLVTSGFGVAVAAIGGAFR